MNYLLDTNVVSELRKGARADAGVRGWFETVAPSAVHLSVLVVGELRRGVERIRRRDSLGARSLELWVTSLVDAHGDRILPIDRAVADVWGRLGVPDPLPIVDGLLAATALVHDLTLVTRDTRDVETTGVVTLNPFRK